MVDTNTFFQHLDQITGQGGFNVAPKLPKPPVAKRVNVNVNLPQAQTSVATGATGTSDIERLKRAIKAQESSNNYGAINHDSGAAGAYQVMPSHINGQGGWDYEALGRDISMQEFMNNPQIQDRIAQYELQKYLNKYGVAGAAAAWYGGEGMVPHMYDKTPQNGYPSMYDYVMSILNKYR